MISDVELTRKELNRYSLTSEKLKEKHLPTEYEHILRKNKHCNSHFRTRKCSTKMECTMMRIIVYGRQTVPKLIPLSKVEIAITVCFFDSPSPSPSWMRCGKAKPCSCAAAIVPCQLMTRENERSNPFDRPTIKMLVDQVRTKASTNHHGEQ